jgi:hypothetical protein
MIETQKSRAFELFRTAIDDVLSSLLPTEDDKSASVTLGASFPFCRKQMVGREAKDRFSYRTKNCIYN